MGHYDSSITLVLLIAIALLISGTCLSDSRILGASYSDLSPSSVPSQSISWSVTWNNSLQGNCSGTPPAGDVYLYSENTISMIGPSGQDWAVALPQGYSFLPNPVGNPSCTVDSQGQVYFYAGGPSGSKVFSLDSQGALTWTMSPSGIKLAGISSETSSSGDIYLTGILPCNCNQSIIAISPEGTQLWNATEPLSRYGLAESSLVPILSPEGVIFLTMEGVSGTTIFALNPNNGTTMWSQVLGNATHLLGPTFGPDGTAYVWYGNTFFAFNPNGTIEWQINIISDLGYEFPGQIIINSNDTLLVNIEYPSTFLELNSSTGDQIWNATLNSNLIYNSWLLGVSDNGDIFAQQFLYNNGVIMNNSTLFGYSPNGTRIWSLPTYLEPPLSIGGANLLVDSGGDALVVAVNNTMYAIAPNGSALWQIALSNGPVSGIDASTPLYIWQSQPGEAALLALYASPYSPRSTETSRITLSSNTTSEATQSGPPIEHESTSSQTTNSTLPTLPGGGIDWPLIWAATISAIVVVLAVTIAISLKRR